jgi:pyruvate/2-oxoglutarate dehydrogenase complex dihydrolipoamide dehydrogenase (E3) component
LVVTGAGPAGIAASIRARRLGAEVTLLERDRLGGVCYNEGPVPVRTLARAARMVRDAGAWGEFGLIGRRPSIDLRVALGRARRAARYIHDVKHLAEKLRAAGIEVAEGIGPARFIDAHTLGLPDGRTISGDRIILAVGGHDRRLQIPGAELGLSFRDVLNLNSLPSRVVVVGGAATGCQLASIFADFGAEVTLIEAAAQLIAKEDAELGTALGRAFVARGIKVRNDTVIQRLCRRGQRLEVEIRHLERDEQLQSEAVFFAVGWPGNLEELNLAAADIETAGGYIRVDAQLRTSQPHVFAVGDVNGIQMLMQTAAHQGYLAAENALLGLDRAYERGIVPSGSFTDPEYASVGLTESQARATRDCIVARHAYSSLTRAVVDNRVDGFCKLIADRRSGVLLGAHVLGEYSAEIIQVAAMCMAARMSVLQIAQVQLAYPTFTQAIGLAALQLAREMESAPRAEVFNESELSGSSDMAWFCA